MGSILITLQPQLVYKSPGGRPMYRTSVASPITTFNSYWGDTRIGANRLHTTTHYFKAKAVGGAGLFHEKLNKSGGSSPKSKYVDTASSAVILNGVWLKLQYSYRLSVWTWPVLHTVEWKVEKHGRKSGSAAFELLRLVHCLTPVCVTGCLDRLIWEPFSK